MRSKHRRIWAAWPGTSGATRSRWSTSTGPIVDDRRHRPAAPAERRSGDNRSRTASLLSPLVENGSVRFASMAGRRNWMLALARHYAHLRSAYRQTGCWSCSRSTARSSTNGSWSVARLLDYDRVHGTDHFRGVEVAEVEVDAGNLERYLIRRGLPAMVRRAVVDWYRQQPSSPEHVPGTERPYPGVLEVIRWSPTTSHSSRRCCCCPARSPPTSTSRSGTTTDRDWVNSSGAHRYPKRRSRTTRLPRRRPATGRRPRDSGPAPRAGWRGWSSIDGWRRLPRWPPPSSAAAEPTCSAGVAARLTPGTQQVSALRSLYRKALHLLPDDDGSTGTALEAALNAVEERNRHTFSAPAVVRAAVVGKTYDPEASGESTG